MITGYSYELWNGKETIGRYYTLSKLQGQNMVCYEVSTFKQQYDEKPKIITVPIHILTVSDDGVNIVLKRVLDVRKKSKRQINILNQGGKF